LVPGTIQEVAALVYQAPSELAGGIRPEAAAEIAELLRNLGFDIRVESEPDAAIQFGKGEFEIAAAVNNVALLPAATIELSSLLGTDPRTARQMLCRTPAVLLSNVSEATVRAVRNRLAPLDIEVDASRLGDARYYAIVSAESRAIRRALAEAIRAAAGEVRLVEDEASVTVEELTRAQAQDLWERLQRTGAKISIYNVELERYDVSLTASPDSRQMRDLLSDLALPDRVIPRVLQSLPVVIRQNVRRDAMLELLARVASAGGTAEALPYSFQRFALLIDSAKDPGKAAELLATLGDVPAADAAGAVNEAKSSRIGVFTRTTALWLQCALRAVGAEARLELL
jgi:hypothetical protein